MGRLDKAVSTRSLPVALTLLLFAGTLASAQSKPATEEHYGKLPLSFEENRGQTDPRVRFLSHGQGYSLFLTSSEAVLSLHAGKRVARKADVVRMQLAGTKGRATVSGIEPLPGKANYLIGSDPAKWHSNVPTYGKVSYRSVYPGVDLVYYGNQRQLEYDFVVAPGADPALVKLHFAGATALKLTAGDLIVSAKYGQISFNKPVVYQLRDGRREAVEGRFRLLAKGTVAFAVGDYDHGRQLVIDPVLAYATYLGGAGSPSSGYSSAYAIAVDETGAAYVTGDTYSGSFPTTTGAYQRSFHGNGDVFVTKLDPSGSSLVYSTYLGGGNYSTGLGIAVDSSGSAYITGSTSSTNFPVTNGAFETKPDTGFVTKLDPTGSSLVYSTYISNTSVYGAIAVDDFGDAFVTGVAPSGFPVTPGAFQTTNNGHNSFVAKIEPTGTGLVWATYLSAGNTAGTTTETAIIRAIALDVSGNVFVTGSPSASDFPVTPGAFQGSISQCFVTKINSAGSGLLYSTYLGGSESAACVGIAIDSVDNAYITGYASPIDPENPTPDFPVTPDAYQTAHEFTAAFLTKLNSTGTGLVYSTFVGGSAALPGVSFGAGVAVDAAGDAFLVGLTLNGFPVTADALQPTAAGQAGFLTELNPTGTSLIYSTYLGGSNSNYEGAGAVALDPSGNAYVAGVTRDSTFPVTAAAYQTELAGYQDAYVAKFGTKADSDTVSITFETSPAGLAYSVDGTSYTSTRTFALVTGSQHSISANSPQTSGGTQNTFSSWSDGDAQSHTITVTATATYTANFNTAFLLTTAVTPATAGTVNPGPGSYYSAGSVVDLTATANSGYAFSSWTGNVANAATASTTVTMNAPESVTASFGVSGVTYLFGNITGKSGSASARAWSIQVSNNGPAAAVGAEVSGITFTQAGGAACTPVVTSALPIAAGNLAPAANVTVSATVDFSNCAANARFTVNVALSANAGSSSGSLVRLNQFQ